MMLILMICVVKSQIRQLALVDEQLQLGKEKILALKRAIATAADRYRRELLRHNSNGPAARRLKKLREQLSQLRETVSSLQAEGTGNVVVALAADEVEESELLLPGGHVKFHGDQASQHKEYNETTIYYDQKTLDVDNFHATDRSSDTVQLPTAAPAADPIANTQSITALAHSNTSRGTTTGTIERTIRFKEFVPDVVKWYG